MRIAVIGAGGVGGYFGALLARAGHEVAMLARGKHLEAIRQHGIRITGESADAGGSSLIVPIPVSDNPAALAGAELAIVAVKSYSLGEVAPILRDLALNDCVILPLLNGVTAADDLVAAGVPRTQILGGLTVVSAWRSAPGVITHADWQELIKLGELDGSLTERAERIRGAIQSAGIKAIVTEHIVAELWVKFTGLCAMAAACGMARSDVHGIRDRPLGRLLIERAIGEIVAVARAKGIPTAGDQEASTIATIDGVPGTMKPSFLLDLERGGPTELDALSGAVSRFGKETGIPTPIHDTAAAVLQTSRTD